MAQKSAKRTWLQTNVPKERRGEIAESILRQRRIHFAFFPSYGRNRSIESLKARQGFLLGKYLRVGIPKSGKLNVLDCGAGFLRLSAGIKSLFGDRVFVTALNVIHPALQKSTHARLIKDINEALYRRELQREMLANLSDIVSAEKNRKLVDEFRVGVIENFSTPRRYGLIVDLSAPLQHSKFQERVLEKYFDLLKPNGRVLVAVLPKTAEEIERIVRTRFSDDNIVSNTGYCFRMRQVPAEFFERGRTSEGAFFEIKKVAIKAAH